MKRSDISTLTVLSAALLAHSPRDKNDHRMTYEYILGTINAPLKVVYAAMERDYDSGYLDYGVSLRSGWLTDEGKYKLRELLDKYRIERP